MLGLVINNKMNICAKSLEMNNYLTTRLEIAPTITPIRKTWIVREFNLRTQVKRQQLVIRRGTGKRKIYTLGNSLTVDRKKLTRYECRKGKWAFVRYRMFYLHASAAKAYQTLSYNLSVARKISPYRDDGIYPWHERKKLCAPLNLDRFKPGKQKK